MNLEICVDNYESLMTALKYGADRIELCSSLKEGGLTPSVGLMELALRQAQPVFVMIRPRSCDFLYTDEEIEIMHRDIHTARQLGAPGVVFGVLTPEGEIDATAMKSLMQEAGSMAVTCHRAFDQVRDVYQAVDALIQLGVKRILTSGQMEDPFDGIQTLKEIVDYASDRILIMAAGVAPHTVAPIISQAGVHEVHSAAAAWRQSQMRFIKTEAKMGNGEDFSLNIVDGITVRAIKANMAGL